jgi:hypothetical protein
MDAHTNTNLMVSPAVIWSVLNLAWVRRGGQAGGRAARAGAGAARVLRRQGRVIKGLRASGRSFETEDEYSNKELNDVLYRIK